MKPLSLLWIAVGVLVAACSGPQSPPPTATATVESGAVETRLPATPAGTARPSPIVVEPTASPTGTPRPTSAPSPVLASPIPTATDRRPTVTPVPVTPATTQTVGARRGGTLNLVAREDITHLDVHLDPSPALSTWGPGLAYSRLLRFRSGPDVRLPSLAVECDVCIDWTMEDERTFVFRLRDNVFWQDLPPVDGRRLDADDVVYSHGRRLESRGANAGPLGVMSLLEAAGPDEVRIGLAVPDSDFMLSLADGRAKIVAREAVEARGDLKQGPTIGSGPWVIASSVAGAFHRFERNSAYFEKDLPFVDSMVLHIIPDATTRDAAFSVETVDIHQLEPQAWVRLLERHPEVRSLLVKETGVGLEVALNTSRPPLNDINVRRAVFQAMDPWAAINEIWLGAAYVSVGFPAVDAGWLLKDRDLRRFFAQPERARDLLNAANSNGPNAVSITVGDFGERYVAHARRIAVEMEAVGFATTLEIVDRRRFGEEVWLGGDYQMFAGPVAPVLSPNAYLIPVLHSLGAWNTTAHIDPELDALIEAQAQESDPVRRTRLIREIQEVALGRAYRFMPATSVSIWSAWPRVGNFHPNFAGFEYSHWSRVWLED